MAAVIFRREMSRKLRRHMGDEDTRSYEAAIPFEHGDLGLARYWRKTAA